MNEYPFFHANARNNNNSVNAHARNNQATYFANNPESCGNGSATKFAGEFIGLTPRGNFGNSAEGGCGIDVQTELRNGDPSTVRLRGPKQLFQRPWATTPFMGLGDIESIQDQSRVKYGYSTPNRKSIQTIMDRQFPVFQPLTPERQADIPESNYFVEKFLRGGFASRLVPSQRVDLR
jgi:hypothetical protein